MLVWMKKDFDDYFEYGDNDEMVLLTLMIQFNNGIVYQSAYL